MTEELVRIQGLAFGGACIGEVISADSQLAGKKVFVDYTVPGEKVSVQILENRQRFLTAKLKQVIEPALTRIKPECPYYTQCGGCHLQHMQINAEREAKFAMVESMLRNQAGLVPLEPMRLLGQNLPEFGYRSRVSLHLSEEGKLGFYREGTGEVVDIESCLIANAEINNTLQKLRKHLNNIPKYVGGVSLETRSSGEILVVFKADTKAPQSDSFTWLDKLNSEFANISLISRNSRLYSKGLTTALGSFSQVNRQANQTLIEAVLESVSCDQVLELYAGAGNFSLALARAGKVIDAVELDENLVEQGRNLANEEGLSTRLRFHRCSAEDYVRKNACPSSVLLDPPRSGAKHVLRLWDDSVLREVVYVSCALPTLVRDLKSLSQAGFILQQVSVLDMFPRTHHVEIIALLRR